MNTAELAAAYGLHRLPMDHLPSRVMVDEILTSVERWLVEAAGPLTPAQVEAFDEAHRVLSQAAA